MDEKNSQWFTFLKREQLTHDTYSFYFKRPDKYEFIPGQYLKIKLPLVEFDPAGNTRYFSIASSPTEKDFIFITTKIRKSEFKKMFLAVKPNTQVLVRNPLGRFTLNEKQMQPHVLLAGGIGITPFRSMIVYAADKHLPIPLTLFTSFSTPTEMIFTRDLHTAAEKNSNIKIVETITKPELAGSSWYGHKGRIDTQFITENVGDVENNIYYICGPKLMVDALSKAVRDLGVTKNHIRTEEFTGY